MYLMQKCQLYNMYFCQSQPSNIYVRWIQSLLYCNNNGSNNNITNNNNNSSNSSKTQCQTILESFK